MRNISHGYLYLNINIPNKLSLAYHRRNYIQSSGQYSARGNSDVYILLEHMYTQEALRDYQNVCIDRMSCVYYLRKDMYTYFVAHSFEI